ncbi:MAG: hypothetical protein WAX89_00945 [Alphaproteobacteria bacterium]
MPVSVLLTAYFGLLTAFLWAVPKALPLSFGNPYTYGLIIPAWTLPFIWSHLVRAGVPMSILGPLDSVAVATIATLVGVLAYGDKLSLAKVAVLGCIIVLLVVYSRME